MNGRRRARFDGWFMDQVEKHARLGRLARRLGMVSYQTEPIPLDAWRSGGTS